MSHNLSIKPPKEILDISQIHLSDENRKKLYFLLEEFTYFEALKKFNLPVDNKILLHGATGCGKTTTALSIAKHLNKNIIILNLGNFVSSKLGETAKNITQIFRTASLEKAVLFIDEFDFIGKERDYDEKDSGEMKRLVNTLIQQIDNLKEDVLLIGATNHIQVIDSALLRRFQLKLSYELPNPKELDAYYDSLTASFPKETIQFKRKYGISYAEVKDFVFQEVKSQIIALEKQKKQLLFSYGTLQLEQVQQETYGRKLVGKADILEGYQLKDLKITDPNVIKKSNKDTHPIAIKSDDENDFINGVIYEITTEELFQTDLYEVNDYKRVMETFKSGEKAWVYVKK